MKYGYGFFFRHGDSINCHRIPAIYVSALLRLFSMRLGHKQWHGRTIANEVVLKDSDKMDHYLYGHDDVIKWKHLPRHWPFVWGIHRSPVNSPHKGQWRRALRFPLICAWTNIWANNGNASELRRHRAHYDIAVMVNARKTEPHWQRNRVTFFLH